MTVTSFPSFYLSPSLDQASQTPLPSAPVKMAGGQPKAGLQDDMMYPTPHTPTPPHPHGPYAHHPPVLLKAPCGYFEYRAIPAHKMYRPPADLLILVPMLLILVPMLWPRPR